MSRETLGLLLGFVGVCIFAGTLPFTHIAVEHLSPLFVTAGRAALAGLLALSTLLALRKPWPSRRQAGTLALVALCLVGGFPGFTALAMQSVPASHGGVVLGILPLATSVISALIAGERPSPAFWLAALAGAALVIGFTLHEGGGSLGQGDVFLLGAAVSSALGYVLSGKLVQAGLAGWEVISWVLVVALPVTVPLALWAMPSEPGLIPAWSWIGFAYVTLMSQYLGFFAWNAGLAIGGIARVSQVQLLQTFVTLLIAAVLNREPIALSAWLVAATVFGLVVAASHARVRRKKS
ncbi:DMT family transporter [Microvirga arsenatis]|uniref:EamA family transporter n=1 Tax=Microvirga arsenatis TaxID=2692265 RepID=A0ABW9YY06_9HYPH|nr:DMT family transporter [Microvirga arsenatis]NBJ11891.1 EamA family transporter [Microvirga arsenatis]NBJ24003.1 EamA family transporter [Microvirga arsenatis]